MQREEEFYLFKNCTNFLIDLVPMTYEERNCAKNSVDLAAELLKTKLNMKEATIARIQSVACYFKLDRVVVYPCLLQGEYNELWHMSGGDIPLFCQHIGIALLSEYDGLVSPAYLALLKQHHGVVLYKRAETGKAQNGVNKCF